MIELVPIGPWSSAGQFAKELPRTLRRVVTAAQERVARKYMRIVKDHIIYQDLPWQAISPNTKKETSTILMETAELYDNIKMWQSGYTIYIGVPVGVRYSRDKAPLIADVAGYHETGTSRMPARPLWEPSVEDLGGEAGISELIWIEIHKKLLIVSTGTGWQITRR